MWGGRDLNKIQTPAQGQWDLDRVGTAAGEGQEGCVAKRLPAWGYPNIAGWFILVRGKMENPWWWFVHVCSVCSCLFSTHVFPAGSKAIPWAEGSEYGPQKVSSRDFFPCSGVFECYCRLPPSIEAPRPTSMAGNICWAAHGGRLADMPNGPKNSLKFDQTGRKFSVSGFRNNRNNFLIGVGYLPMHHDLMGGLSCNHLQWGRHFAESHRTWPEGKCATGCGPSCERWSLFGPGQLGTFKRGRWPWRTTVGKSNAIAINHHFRDGSFLNLRHLDSQEQPLTLRAAYFSWAPLWTAQWLEYIPHSPMLFEEDHPKSIGFRKKNQSLVAWGPGGCNSRFNWAQVNQGQPVSPLCFRPQAAGTHRFSSTGAEGAGDLRSHSAPHFHRNLSAEAHEKIREIDHQKYVLWKGEGTDVCGILFF